MQIEEIHFNDSNHTSCRLTVRITDNQGQSRSYSLARELQNRQTTRIREENLEDSARLMVAMGEALLGIELAERLRVDD